MQRVQAWQKQDVEVDVVLLSTASDKEFVLATSVLDILAQAGIITWEPRG